MPLQRKDFLGVTDQYLDTSAYNLDPSFNYYLQDPRELDQRRLRAYKYYMDFYDGKHWDDVIGSVTMSEWNPAYGYYYSWNEDFNRRTWNFSRMIIDKLVDWFCQEEWKNKVPPELAPEPKNNQPSSFGFQQGGQTNDAFPSQGQQGGQNSQPGQSSGQQGGGQQNSQPGQQGGQQPDPMSMQKSVYNTDKTETPSDRKHDTQQVLDNVWIANERHAFTYNLAYQSFICGDAFVRMSWDDNFYADGVGELVLQVLDSRTVIPYWDGQNKRKMIGCRIQYPVREVQGDGSVKMRMYTEVHTESTIVELLDGQVTNNYTNPLGELMIIHFPNEPLPYRKYGKSDLESLLLPNKEFNEKASDFSEILAYHAAPVTIIKGARVQNLERGARKVWGGIPKDGDVFNLELQTDMSSTQEYLTMLQKHLFEAGNVPEESLGSEQQVSNTSAVALQIQYQPLIERTKRKHIHVGKGLRQINRLILRFYEMAGVWEAPDQIAPSRKYRVEIEWGDSLPRDRSLELADIATEIGLGIESKQGALVRLGCEDPNAKLQEIEQELKADAMLQFQTAGMMGTDATDDQNGADGGALGGDSDPGGGPSANATAPQQASAQNPAVHGQQVSSMAAKKASQTGSGPN